MLAEVKIERAVHAQLVLDDLVHVAVETTVEGVEVQVQVVGHGPVVVQGAHQLRHHLRRCGRRFRGRPRPRRGRRVVESVRQRRPEQPRASAP